MHPANSKKGRDIVSTVRLLSAEEVAAILNCQPSTVEAAWRAGTLPGFRLGQHWRVPETALYEGIHALAMKNCAAAQPATPPAPTAVLVAVPNSTATNQRGRRSTPPVLPDLPQLSKKAG